MVLTGLLLIALVSLALGLAWASVTWLVVSLVASVLAAFVLYRSWGTIKKRRTNMARRKKAADQPVPAPAAAGGSSASVAAPVPSAAGLVDVLVVDGRPAYHQRGCVELDDRAAEPIPLSQALEDGFTACPTCAPPTSVSSPAPAPAAVAEAVTAAVTAAAAGSVWVVDGSPDFHDKDCPALIGEQAEPIPLSQALEDGFAACPVCQAAAAAAAAASPGAAQVWVADGFPEYHHEGCDELAGLDAVAVPYDQAVEDGFQPCVVCNPDRAFGAGAPLPERRVWVVDGRPEYHRTTCRRLAETEAEPIPHGQAVEDGFVPCSVCDPDSAEIAAPLEPAAAVTTEFPAARPSAPRRVRSGSPTATRTTTRRAASSSTGWSPSRSRTGRRSRTASSPARSAGRTNPPRRPPSRPR